jgi:hypothetical protein
MSRHISGNRNQIQKTLNDFIGKEEEWKDHLKWMRSLPLFLELGPIRIVHAYWNDADIQVVKEVLPKGSLKKNFLRNLHEEHPDTAAILYKLMKGLEFKCPKDLILKCSKGLSRKVFALKWWVDPKDKTFNQMYFGNKFILPEYHFPKELEPTFEPYLPNQPIVFIGHYCMSDGAEVLQQNLCCIDSCVDSTGRLSAYKWSGEKELTARNILTVS